jgi:cytochrome c oxidase cbb3-type subunit 4
MYKEVLSGIKDIGVYPSISFVVFFVFFIAIAVWLLRSKSMDFENVSRAPLSDMNDPNTNIF